jgi:pyruvate/2-oxoglutarate dehydrogenase complex dihydrolipoamide acyltransferase (E2) component
VHRDLKPENIMLLHDEGGTATERVKVLDFGIAKILERDSPSSDGSPNSVHSALTSVGTVVGTPAYMSPEQCRGEAIDTRSDIYTCGILLYQLVCGRLPFSGDNAMDLAVAHVRTPPMPPSEIVPAIHPALAAIILKALSKWPAERQQTAAELRDALQQLLPELSPSPLVPAAVARPEAKVEKAPAPAKPAPEAAKPQAPAFAKTLDPDELKAPVLPADLLAAAREPANEDAATSVLAMPPEGEALRAHIASARPPPGAAGPRPAAAPTVPTPGRASAALAPAKQRPSPLRGWLVVPFALVLGVAMGALAFLLSRP